MDRVTVSPTQRHKTPRPPARSLAPPAPHDKRDEPRNVGMSCLHARSEAGQALRCAALRCVLGEVMLVEIMRDGADGRVGRSIAAAS